METETTKFCLVSSKTSDVSGDRFRIVEIVKKKKEKLDLPILSNF